MNRKKQTQEFEWGGVHPFSYHPFIFHFVPDLRDKKSVDCGCGKGIWGYLMRTTRDFGKKGEIYGIDLKKDYLEFVKKHNVYDKTYNTDITKLPFKKNEIDFLICSEVIEHLTEIDGKEFLQEVDRVVKPGGRAIITTPNVEMDTFIDEGPDSHSSLWSPEYFRKKGFKVYGTGVRIAPGIDKWYTLPVLALGYVLTPISYFIPEIGGFMIAVKDY